MGKPIAITVTKEKAEVAFIIFSALLVTFLLFYIDEGYYNFSWIKNIGSWIAFVLYTAGIVAAQVFINQLMLKKYNGKHKLAITALVGIPLGICFTVFFLTQII